MEKTAQSHRDCRGTAEVTIRFDASGDLVSEDTCIVLLLDRSGSMSGKPLEYLKRDAKKLVRAVSLASSGPAEGPLGGNTRIAIFSFSGNSILDIGLTRQADALMGVIDRLTAGGSANHAATFDQAYELLKPYSAIRRKVVMFTDGMSGSGDPGRSTRKLKQTGVEIFCVGLLGNPTQLLDWASEPKADHVSCTQDPAQLDRVFDEITAEVVEAGARDVILRETVNPEFQIAGSNIFPTENPRSPILSHWSGL